MNEKQIRDNFRVRISGIELRKHCISISCNKEFFELAGIDAIKDGSVDLRIEMEKSEKMVDFYCHFVGDVYAECDRCLDLVKLPLDFEERLLVKLVSETSETQEVADDDIWLMDENTYEVDLFHFAYESISLAIPLRIVHEDDENGNPTCNPEVMRKLEEMNSDNKNNQETDPRWDALKNIKLD